MVETVLAHCAGVCLADVASEASWQLEQAFSNRPLAWASLSGWSDVWGAAPGAAPQTSDHPDSDAQAKGLFETACSSCHDTSLATQAKQTPAQWANTVATMVSRGAPLDDQQAAEVSDYLAKHYGGG